MKRGTLMPTANTIRSLAIALAMTGLALAMTGATMHCASADDFYREDLRIPMASAGPRCLEAMLVRPSGTQRYPLALLSHGAPRDAGMRAGMTPKGLYSQAIEFARRGFAALVVMRRGYGASGGNYAEDSGPCDRRNYLVAAKASASDLRAAIDAVKNRTDVTTRGMIAVGVSAGGFASVALTADPPPGLAAAISFAGGRGSRTDNDVCDEDALARAFGVLGKTSRTPMLWVYAQNDKFFAPSLAHRLHAEFSAAGGRAEFIDAPAFGSDGHGLFSAAAASIWIPIVDRFLREQNLGTRDLIAAPTAAALPPPPGLGTKAREGFAAYLVSAPHKAFAASPKRGFAYRTGLRSASEAQQAALAECAKYAPDCALVAVDDERVGSSR
jgi:dienelactone hydrolase